MSDPIEVVRLAVAEPAQSAASETARPRIGVERPPLELPEVRVATAGARQELTARVGRPEGLELGRIAKGRGRGASAGSGEGGDGTSGKGGETVGDAYTPPVPSSILPSWRPSRAVYGATALARVFVDREGRPKGPVELARATSHSRTDEEIVYRVRHLMYRPAQRNGVPVDAWAEVAFEFCYEGVTATSPPSPTFGVGEPCAKPRAAGAES